MLFLHQFGNWPHFTSDWIYLCLMISYLYSMSQQHRESFLTADQRQANSLGHFAKILDRLSPHLPPSVVLSVWRVSLAVSAHHQLMCRKHALKENKKSEINIFFESELPWSCIDICMAKAICSSSVIFEKSTKPSSS